MIHRLETNKLRNVSCLFAHLLATDALPWSALTAIRLTEEDTTSSSRIFIKYLFQVRARTARRGKFGGVGKGSAPGQGLLSDVAAVLVKRQWGRIDKHRGGREGAVRGWLPACRPGAVTDTGTARRQMRCTVLAHGAQDYTDIGDVPEQ